ncbi:MAG: DUF6290 family protein [Clostridium sp.]|uniref:DUF6290 family protein n=1 Tax=Clostridium sp. TaxID=1506 RepID=UPI003F33ACD3
MKNFLSDLFQKIFYKDEEVVLNDRLEIRINDKEKILFKKYAKLNGTDLSKLMRKLMMAEIDDFIKVNK